MAQVEYATSTYKTPLHHRITASMPVQASWIDTETGERIRVETNNMSASQSMKEKMAILKAIASAVR